MTRFWQGIIVGLALLVAIPALSSTTPFNLRVVDARTGAGIPNLRITTDNGIVCYTYGPGIALFGESSLMHRRVRFTIEDEAHRFQTVTPILSVSGGRETVVAIHPKP